jgi:hypothetical protein
MKTTKWRGRLVQVGKRKEGWMGGRELRRGRGAVKASRRRQAPTPAATGGHRKVPVAGVLTSPSQGRPETSAQEDPRQEAQQLFCEWAAPNALADAVDEVVGLMMSRFLAVGTGGGWPLARSDSPTLRHVLFPRSADGTGQRMLFVDMEGIPKSPCRGRVLEVMVMVAADHVGYPHERISHLSSDHQEPGIRRSACVYARP